MRTRISSALLLVLLAMPAVAGIFRTAPKNGVPDVYIVVLNEGAATNPGAPRPDLPTVAQAAQSLGRAHGGKVVEVWEHALHGFIINMPDARARKLAEDPRVKSVEQNFSISAAVPKCNSYWDDARPSVPPDTSPQSIDCVDPDPTHDTNPGTPVCKDNWGLDRVDAQVGLNGQYTFANKGAVNIYVLDTGIFRTHREFTGRVANGFDAAVAEMTNTNNPPPPNDCYGHGTHVAGIAAGRTFGVAKDAVLHPVQTERYVSGSVCAKVPYSTLMSVLARALNWIVSDVTSKRSSTNPYPAVVNWSGGNDTNIPTVSALQDAVRSAINNRIVVVQSAGNYQGDYSPTAPLKSACDYTFGGVIPEVIVAGGIDQYDGRWTQTCAGDQCGSLTGSCVDIWAPAADVISSYFGGWPTVATTKGACALTGTSMAAPHVSGVAGLYLHANPTASVADVEAALRSRGTWNVLENDPGDGKYIGPLSDNVLLSSNTTSMGTNRAPVAKFTKACPGRQCTFDAATSSDDNGITSYTWIFGDGTANGTGAHTTHTFPANFDKPVTLRVTDGSGFTDHWSMQVAVNSDAPPTASFTVSCAAATCTFDSNASTDDQSIASRSWTFGDSTTGSGTTVSHTYAASGTYSVVLTVTDNAGQTGTQTQGVPVTISVASPTNVAATATGANVGITWTPVSGVDGYKVERKISSGAWQQAQIVTGASSSSATDTPSAPNGVVMYRVLAYIGTTDSQSSNMDVAYAASFSNDPLTVPTGIRAEHVTELRRAVNILRDIAGQSPVYTSSEVDPNVLQTQAVDDAHFTTLMTNLNAARALFNLPPVNFGTPPAAPGGVYSTQLNDLRNGLK